MGTVIEPRPKLAEAYGRVGRLFGSTLHEREIEGRFQAAWADEEVRDEELRQRTNELRERDRWSNIVRRVFDDVDDAAGLFAALWDHFAAAENWRVFADVAPAWSRLRQAGLRLGVASNFDRRLLELCNRLPPLDSAEQVIVSSLAGRRKPHHHFFDQAAAALRLPTEQILFVGDSLEHDYRPALAAGMSAVLLARMSAAERSPQVSAAVDLLQIAALFDQNS